MASKIFIFNVHILERILMLMKLDRKGIVNNATIIQI